MITGFLTIQMLDKLGLLNASSTLAEMYTIVQHIS